MSSLRKPPHERWRSLSFEPLDDRLLLSATSAMLEPGTRLSAAAATALPQGFTPQQIRQAYGFDQVRFSGGTIVGDGRGQTIAIVDAYDEPHIAADLAHFDQAFGLLAPPSFQRINQQGGASLPPADAGWGLEIALDIEWAHAIAPAANLLLVEASSNQLADMLQAVNYARWLPSVSVVSMSWGSGEFTSETNYESYFTTPPGHTPVAFVASSGDSGQPALWPAVSPNVLAVGGTRLMLNASETGWSGSGGGPSAYENEPSFQGSVQLSGKRSAPDVAYVADPATGVAVYDTLAYNGQSGWFQLGGTSVGAPQWAALVAVADQGRDLAGHLALNGVEANVYQLPASDFHTPPGAASYSSVTGRGTPNAVPLINDLLAAPTMVGSATRNWDNPGSPGVVDTPATLVGSTLTLTDTSGAAFTLVFSTPNTFQVSFGTFHNQYSLSQVSRLVFQGNGFNAATITGLPAHTTASLGWGTGDIAIAGLGISLRSVQTISATAASGDTAILTDSAGTASFTASGGADVLLSGRFANSVAGFASVYAYHTGPGSDVAFLYSSSAASQLVSVPNRYAWLRSGSSFVEVVGFAWVYAYQTTAGGTATLYDSPGNDNFVSTPSYSSMQGSGSFVEAVGFRQVIAIASAGGRDMAWLYDGAGANTLTTQGNQASLVRASTAVAAIGFGEVVAQGGAGSDKIQVAAPAFKLDRYGPWKL